MTSTNPKMIHALGLCSGGLDSILAGMVLKQQGLAVTWIAFETPFFSADKARQASLQTGIPLRVQNITGVYLEMLKDPPCGYGQHMNPCMDCHTLMFRLAGQVMQSGGFHFMFSGEVLGQRPMSQVRSSLRYVEKHSGFDGLILRPLSALNLPETRPEQEGWVDRQRLLDIAGRSRKRQMALAADLGITEYPSPAGGCLLTDKGYSNRLRDLFAHTADCSERDLNLLKHGRHLRIDRQTKLVVGRNSAENERIKALYEPHTDTLLQTIGFPGPLVMAPNRATPSGLETAAAICAGYSKAPADKAVDVSLQTGEESTSLSVVPLPRVVVQPLLIKA